MERKNNFHNHGRLHLDEDTSTQKKDDKSSSNIRNVRLGDLFESLNTKSKILSTYNLYRNDSIRP